MLVSLHSVTISRQSNKMSGEALYANVKFNRKPGVQAAAKLCAGPTPPVSAAGKASSYRQPALVLFILCCLLLVAIIALAVYHFRTKEDLEKYTSLHINRLPQNQSQLLDKYCPLKEGSSKERVCCPEKWVQSNGKCYYFSTDTMNWHSSRASCVSMGADLVIIESETEQRFLMNATKAQTAGNRYWMGLTDSVTEGVWLWVDGTPLNDKAQYWYDKEPNDRKGGEDSSGEDCACLVYQPDHHKVWFDVLCTLERYRICETMAVIINI